MSGWKPFQLMELPQPEYQRRHNETCMVCRDHWIRSAFAHHEATHAAVALDQGLRVEFTSIDEQREVAVTALEAALYPTIRPGMKIPAICTRLDPRDLRHKPEEVMVAMVAPSCTVTGHPSVDDYAGMESFIAVRQMKARGLDPDPILDRAKLVVSEPHVQNNILDLAKQLAATGWVDLVTR